LGEIGDRIWLDDNTNGVQDAGDVSVRAAMGPSGSETVSATLAAGELAVGDSVELEFDGLQTLATPGTFYVRADVDAGGATEEASEGNNFGMAYYTTYDANALPDWVKPDFVVQSVTLDPSPAVAGSKFDALVTIRNDGDIAGDAGILAVWGSSSAYTSSPSGAAEKSQVVGVLAPAEQQTLRFRNLVAPDAAGTYHALAVIDATSATAEMAEGNNHSGATYSLEYLRVQVTPTNEGVELSWNSSPGFFYFLERAAGPDQSYELLADHLPAQPPVTTYLDANPPSGTAVYRVWGWRP
jgi:hypothetical protein